jgi:PilZ domain-containing protein
MQQYPRLYPRQRPQGRISGVAKILFDAKAPKAPVIDCILVDYSAGGACLQLQKFIDLPNRFEVLYGTTRKRCRIVWKRGMRIGVAF